jgi:beta-xylosidase
VEEVIAMETPVVLALLSGRPYAADWAVDQCAAVLEALF